MEGHPVLNKIYESWLTQTEYHPVLRGDEITEYYKIVKPQIAFPDYRQDVVQFGYFFFFPEGGVYAWTEKEIQQDELQIYRRFTSVLSLTYKRYRDLQKAEGNAKEAVKQSVLDRIRADIASMRTVTDLDRITPLIWNELAVLGIPFIRCGVFIMDEKQEMIHTFLSTPDGKAIAAFQLAYTTPGNISEIIKHWRKKEIYCDHWDEDTFREFANGLEKHGEFTSSKDYVSTLPPGGFYLHFVPFLQGMLYVGNTTPLGERDKQLIQSIADAFSTAYARYEDFNKLEEAKKQVDKTLLELQATQKQLIQSEKMASLGELTAGIAHEIQNPLNFVNNFSDVNKELLEELKEEIKRGNFDEVKSIANDVIENEQKINHHGKRADAIVKGMLQHSRKSSGQKEPTDINALADEYLRLSYHGLRAKDKAFNAQFITDFDESVGKIDVVPQEIGRVLLNLFNNAFYAVNERQKGESAKMNADYKPLVSVETKKLKDKIEIKISDNGNGIPQKIMDKIYQPFFTTKPTGEGTGLGLSLSYDIIKATGGEIKMETKEGEGTEFSIELPIK
jgi:signal transduction histidine kinase